MMLLINWDRVPGLEKPSRSLSPWQKLKRFVMSGFVAPALPSAANGSRKSPLRIINGCDTKQFGRTPFLALSREEEQVMMADDKLHRSLKLKREREK